MGRDEVGQAGSSHGDLKVLVASLGIILRAIGSHGGFLKDLLSFGFELQSLELATHQKLCQ